MEFIEQFYTKPGTLSTTETEAFWFTVEVTMLTGVRPVRIFRAAECLCGANKKSEVCIALQRPRLLHYRCEVRRATGGGFAVFAEGRRGRMGCFSAEYSRYSTIHRGAE